MVAVNNILVATDFGDASEAALLYGRALAQKFGARLHVLHVLENAFLRATVLDPGAVEAAALRRLHNCITDDDRRSLGAEAKMVKSDAPAAEIVEHAKATAADLIVIGTHGRAGVSHLLMGSVAERIVRTAPCPVLTVRHPEREFVVPDVPASVAERVRPS